MKSAYNKNNNMTDKTIDAMFLPSSLQYLTEYDYENEYHCSEYGCRQDDYCRCSTIINTKITAGIDTESFTSNKFKNENVLTQYCIERILSINGFWDKSNFEVIAGRGYYGEEVDGVEFNNTNKVKKEIKELLALPTDNEKIEYVLKLEYNNIPADLLNKNWYIDIIDINEVDKPNQTLSKKIDIVARYQQWNLPRCLCKFDGSKFRLIDGNHRFDACQDSVIEIIYCKI